MMEREMETIEEEIKSAMPAVMARVKQEALDSMERESLRIAVQVATDEARKWATEVLAPEVRAQLEAGKDGMLAKAQEISSKLSDGIADALMAEMKKNLSQSWNVKKIADARFRVKSPPEPHPEKKKAPKGRCKLLILLVGGTGIEPVTPAV